MKIFFWNREDFWIRKFQTKKVQKSATVKKCPKWCVWYYISRIKGLQNWRFSPRFYTIRQCRLKAYLCQKMKFLHFSAPVISSCRDYVINHIMCRNLQPMALWLFLNHHIMCRKCNRTLLWQNPDSCVTEFAMQRFCIIEFGKSAVLKIVIFVFCTLPFLKSKNSEFLVLWNLQCVFLKRGHCYNDSVR